MNIQHLIIGIIGFCWGAGMIYFSKAKHIPKFIKPFVSTWWIRSEGANQILALIFGYGAIIGGFLYLIGGITGKKIFPFP